MKKVSKQEKDKLQSWYVPNVPGEASSSTISKEEIAQLIRISSSCSDIWFDQLISTGRTSDEFDSSVKRINDFVESEIRSAQKSIGSCNEKCVYIKKCKPCEDCKYYDGESKEEGD